MVNEIAMFMQCLVELSAEACRVLTRYFFFNNEL